MNNSLIEKLLKTIDNNISEYSVSANCDINKFNILRIPMCDFKGSGVSIDTIRDLVFLRQDDCISKLPIDFRYVSLLEIFSVDTVLTYTYYFCKHRIAFYKDESTMILKKNESIIHYNEYWG